VGGPRWKKGKCTSKLKLKDSGPIDRIADGGTYVLVLFRPTCACATGTRVATVERKGQRDGIVRKTGALSWEAVMPDIPDMQ